MATAVKRLCSLARQSSKKPPVRKSKSFIPPFAPQQWRPFTSSAPFFSEKSNEPGPRTAGPVDASAIENEIDVVEEADARIQSLEEGGDTISAAGPHGDVHHQIEHDDARRSALEELEKNGEAGKLSEDETLSALHPPSTDIDPYDRGTIMRPPSAVYRSEEEGQTFWSGPLGDDYGEEDEFEEDDISSLGHGELEQHREMRDYARIAAWEMPLLSSMLFPALCTSW